MKKRHVIGLLLLSVALSHALAPAIAWAQFKAQNAFYSLTVTDTITASGDVTADQYVASGSASQYSCSKTDGTCQFSSATADGTTSSTVGSFTFKAGANITAADLLFDVQDSSGNHAVSCTEAGQCTALTGFGVPANGVLGLAAGNTHGFTYDGTNLQVRLSNASYGRINNSSGRLTWDYQVLLAGATPQLATSLATSTFGITSATNDATTSATVGAFTLQATADITAADLVLDVQDSAAAHIFTVTEAGAVSSTLGNRINTAGGGSKPTCDSSVRGTLWYVASGAGVADTAEICAKAAADTYAWRSIATIP